MLEACPHDYAEATMGTRKPHHHFGLALIMALFAFFPFRLNPDGLTTIDVAAVIVFGLLAVFLAVFGVLAMRRGGSNESIQTDRSPRH